MKINKTYNSNPFGFTIVELLIVIVVIGILAAITIVAFNGVSNRAKVSSMLSDLESASKQIELYKTITSSTNTYPPDTTTANIKASNSAAYSYYNNAGSGAYCLTETNGTLSYFVATNITPQAGNCLVANGIVGSWSLNNNLNDSSGGGFNGTNINSATTTTGQSGLANGAYAFNGSNQSISIPPTVNQSTNNVTLSTWVNNPSTSNHGAFIKLGDNNTGYGIGIGNPYLDTNGNNIVLIFEQVRWITTATTLPTGWHYVVMVIDAGGTPSVYLDGSFAGTYPGAAPIAPANQSTIGGYGSSRFFNGSIDDARVYNRVLSATEIQTLYAAGAQ